ncbi:MAG: TonB-dependent receptor [Candidatus Neomarinimicrobiota bacterium]
MRRFFLISVLIVIGLTIAFGQQATGLKQDIQGYVKDFYSGEVLPYANISLRGTERGTSSNAEGYFVLINVSAGVCSLQVTYMGYEKTIKIVDNQGDQRKPVIIDLKPRAIDLEGVEVVADAYEIFKISDNVSQISLSPRELQTLPSFGEVDIFRSLQLLPGISGVGDGKSGLYVRGGTPDQNMVILDGMTVYHVDHFFGMFSVFNADAIKDVQLYKGGYPAKYGGRLSSIVELTGKRGSEFRELSVNVNLLSANLLYQTPFWDDRGSWLLSARRSYTDILQSPFYNDIYSYVTGEEAATTGSQSMNMGRGPGGGALGQTVVPSFYYYDINNKLSVNPTERDLLSFSFYAGRDYLDKSRELDLGGPGFTGSSGASFESRLDENLTDWGNIGGSLKWAHQWNRRGFTNLLLSNSEYNSNYERNLSFSGSNVIGIDDSTGSARGLGAFAQNEYNTVNDVTLRLDNQWQVTERHKMEFGADLNLVNTQYRATILDTVNILLVDSDSRTTALYLQDQWKLTPLIELTAGWRSTHYDQTDKIYHTPRLSLSWMLTDRLQLKGAWGQYNQFINNITNENVLQGSNDFWLTADENIIPGFAEHSILGFSYNTPVYLLEVEAYYKTMDNLVEFSRRFQDQSDYLNYFFFGSGVSQGVEFLAQKKTGALTGWVSYTLGRVDQTFPNLNDGEPFPASHDRRHELKAVGTYKLGKWNLAATWMFSTGNAYTAPESQYFLEMLDGSDLSYIHVGEKNAYRLPDYHRLDLSASRKFESYSSSLGRPVIWDVGVSIYNLYNHDNVSYRDYDLDVTPIIVSDVLMLGFTPTLFVKLNL